ncbi:hypothetical protein EK904_015171 [Melospiza melodia maxima]|nr:hypothetical protein EK904_015171 [Melospiza melodia maxima]
MGRAAPRGNGAGGERERAAKDTQGSSLCRPCKAESSSQTPRLVIFMGNLKYPNGEAQLGLERAGLAAQLSQKHLCPGPLCLKTNSSAPKPAQAHQPSHARGFIATGSRKYPKKAQDKQPRTYLVPFPACPWSGGEVQNFQFVVHLESGEAVSNAHLTDGTPAAALECSQCNGFLQGRHPCFPESHRGVLEHLSLCTTLHLKWLV